MDTRQIILFFIFGFSVLLLVDGWQKANAPTPVAQVAQKGDAAAQADPAAAVPGSAPAAAPSLPRRAMPRSRRRPWAAPTGCASAPT